jgi:shikimate dehydrogenase
MHNAAFEALGLNWRYVPLAVPTGSECMAAYGLMALGFRGANVTAPHKMALLRCIDHLSQDAQALGAVNTISLGRGDESESVLVGHNTDHTGLIDALLRSGFEPRGEDAVVVGAGGAARAAVFGLLQAGIKRMTVLARHVEQAEDLVRDLEDGSKRLSAGALSEEVLIEIVRRSAVLVHATPMGSSGISEGSIWPEATPFPSETLAYDLVSVPRRTRLLQQAEASGAPCLGGLEMLISQGARSFALWTEREAPIDVMRTACENALKEVAA